MVAVGLFAVNLGGAALWLVPSAFVGTMIFGGMLGYYGWPLPMVEEGIGLSVVVMGLAIALGVRLPTIAAMALVGLFAVFHGHAHGTEGIGLGISFLPYAAGFVAATGLLHVSGIALGLGLDRLGTTPSLVLKRVGRLGGRARRRVAARGLADGLGYSAARGFTTWAASKSSASREQVAMHELGITRNVVAIVSEAARGRRVSRVTLEVGKLAGVMPDAIAFCFDTVAKGTAIEGAVLEIREIEGRCRCRTCGAEFATPALFTPCPCGSQNLERLSGEELNIKSMQLEEAA